MTTTPGEAAASSWEIMPSLFVSSRLNIAALPGPPDDGDEPDIDAGDEEDEIDEAPATPRRASEVGSPSPRADTPARPQPSRVAASRADQGSEARKLELAKLQTALQDLVACRQLLDSALKDG